MGIQFIAGEHSLLWRCPSITNWYLADVSFLRPEFPLHFKWARHVAAG